MKWRGLALGLVVSLVVGCGGSDGTAQVSGQQGNATFPEIAAVMSQPRYREATWGLRVVDLESGNVLVDQSPDTLFYIGSVRKIFSVGLLLNAVGSEHTYDTPVFRQGTVDPGGLLDGDLVLVASGDLTMGGRTNPDGSLSVPDSDHNEANSLGNAILSQPDPLRGYRSLAAQVAASGITRVGGDVVIDDRLFQPFNFRDEFDVRPIFVNDNVVDVSIFPGSVGSLAAVTVRPLSSALTIVNEIQTAAAGTELDLDLEPELPQIGVPGASATISGNLPIDFVPLFTGDFPLIRTFRITQPSNFARTVFIEALEEAGVEVDAATVKANPTGILPAKDSYQLADRVALLKGTPYAQLADYVLKISYNIGADTSLVLFGLTKGVDSMPAALAAEREVLSQRFGLDPSRYRFLDGSGGGETTAANQVVTAMIAGLLQSEEAESFVAALPVLGEAGSLGFVTDFAADPTLAGAVGKVRAKTGTYVTLNATEDGLLARGQALGGIIEAKSGRRLVYQLVVNNVPIDSIEDLMKIFQDQGIISAILWRDL